MTDFTRWEVQSRLLTYFLYIMKILIVSQYYFPEQFQINDIAPELVKRGHEITILCGLPNYPKGVYFEGFDNKESVEIKEKEYFKQTGVHVIHIEQVLRSKNPLKLVMNYFMLFFAIS